MKLGIFGGTFNPIHYGHLINAERARSDFELDRMILVPVKRPVHKELAGNVPAEDRYAMARLAVEGAREFDVSRIEIDREGPSYTVTTVREIQERYPGADLHLVIGMDSLNEIGTWRDAGHLLGQVTLVVMRRPGEDRQGGWACESARVKFLDNPLIDIRSTEIRERLAEGRSVRFLTPDPVLEYIRTRGFYLK